jgi:hypothetical protein
MNTNNRKKAQFYKNYFSIKPTDNLVADQTGRILFRDRFNNHFSVDLDKLAPFIKPAFSSMICADAKFTPNDDCYDSGFEVEILSMSSDKVSFKTGFADGNFEVHEFLGLTLADAAFEVISDVITVKIGDFYEIDLFAAEQDIDWDEDRQGEIPERVYEEHAQVVNPAMRVMFDECHPDAFDEAIRFEDPSRLYLFKPVTELQDV